MIVERMNAEMSAIIYAIDENKALQGPCKALLLLWPSVTPWTKDKALPGFVQIQKQTLK